MIVRCRRFRQQITQNADHILSEPGRILFLKVGRIIGFNIFDLGKQLCASGMCFVRLCCGPGSLPVCTGKHSVQLPVAVQIILYARIAVDDLIACHQIFSNLNILRQCQCNRALFLMRVAGYIQGIFARLQFISAETILVCIPVIIAGCRIRFKGNRHSFTLPRLQKRCFRISCQHLMGFFNAALRIWSRNIKLDHFLTRRISRIFYRYRNRNHRLQVKFVCRCLAYIPLKRRIA